MRSIAARKIREPGRRESLGATDRFWGGKGIAQYERDHVSTLEVAQGRCLVMAGGTTVDGNEGDDPHPWIARSLTATLVEAVKATKSDREIRARIRESNPAN